MPPRELTPLERTTIAGWEADREAVEAEHAVGYEPESVELDSRQAAGVLVELRLSTAPISGVVFLRVTEGEGEPVIVGIPPSRARDAFDHPYLYLPRERAAA